MGDNMENVVENTMSLTGKNDEQILTDDKFALYNELWFQIFIFFALILFIFVPLIPNLLRSKSKRDILLLGLTDVGKTLIFARLLNDKCVQTQTSIKENVGVYLKPSGGNLRIVDVPGHERLRLKFFDKFRTTARGIVFVVDASTIQKDIRDVAEFLYTILTDYVISTAKLDILILCNKQDLLTAKSAKIVCQLLQKEINTLRTTKASELESTDVTKSKTKLLGKEGAEFEFSYLPYKVQFAECTTLFADEEKPADLDQLRDWINKL